MFTGFASNSIHIILNDPMLFSIQVRLLQQNLSIIKSFLKTFLTISKPSHAILSTIHPRLIVFQSFPKRLNRASLSFHSTQVFSINSFLNIIPSLNVPLFKNGLKLRILNGSLSPLNSKISDSACFHSPRPFNKNIYTLINSLNFFASFRFKQSIKNSLRFSFSQQSFFNIRTCLLSYKLSLLNSCHLFNLSKSRFNLTLENLRISTVLFQLVPKLSTIKTFSNLTLSLLEDLSG